MEGLVLVEVVAGDLHVARMPRVVCCLVDCFVLRFFGAHRLHKMVCCVLL